MATVARLVYEPPPSALNMTLPAFAAEHRAAAPLLPTAGACCCMAPTAVSCPRRAQQQTRWPPLLLPTDGTDRQTDGWTLYHYIDSAPHTMQAESINE